MRNAVLLFLLVATAVPAASAGPPAAGDPCPAFTLRSGRRGVLQSSSLRGRVLVITYETREVTKKNSAFKNRVLEYYFSVPDRSSLMAPLPVINCHKYIGPVKTICTQSVLKESASHSIPIYDDRDGKMFRDFCMQDDESNVIIIDRQGIILYRRAGLLSRQDIDAAMVLIQTLVGR